MAKVMGHSPLGILDAAAAEAEAVTIDAAVAHSANIHATTVALDTGMHATGKALLLVLYVLNVPGSV